MGWVGGGLVDLADWLLVLFVVSVEMLLHKSKECFIVQAKSGSSLAVMRVPQYRAANFKILTATKGAPPYEDEVEGDMMEVAVRTTGRRMVC